MPELEERVTRLEQLLERVISVARETKIGRMILAKLELE